MRALTLAPLVVALALGLVFLVRLMQGGATQDVPSPLINQLAPALNLTEIEGVETALLTNEAFANDTGEITLLNVWASWCGPCRVEHPQIEALALESGVNVVGLNYKDKPAAATAFLAQLGNPYVALGADPTGGTAIDYGVYGVPETFLIDGDGVIRAKYIGPITEAVFKKEVLPDIAALKK